MAETSLRHSPRFLVYKLEHGPSGYFVVDRKEMAAVFGPTTKPDAIAKALQQNEPEVTPP